MEKKIYQTPEIKKVRLDLNGAVLAVCHSSTIQDSAICPSGCRSQQCSQSEPGIPPACIG